MCLVASHPFLTWSRASHINRHPPCTTRCGPSRRATSAAPSYSKWTEGVDDVGLIKETLLRACTTNPCVSKISKNICRMDDNNARYYRCRLMPMYCVLHQHGQSHKESKMLKNVVKQKILRPVGA